MKETKGLINLDLLIKKTNKLIKYLNKKHKKKTRKINKTKGDIRHP
jgi:hypothetical protein